MNRQNSLQKKFDKNIIDKALNIKDPTDKNKYLEWICQQIKAGHNIPDIEGTIDWFYRNSNKLKFKDIFKYKNLKDLENEIKDLGESKRKTISEEKLSDKVYEDDDTLVIYPLTSESIKYYGSNTRWCITMENSSYLKDYIEEDNHFYIIINKKIAPTENKHKLCLLLSPEKHLLKKGIIIFNTLSVYDANDNYMALNKVFNDKNVHDIWSAIIEHQKTTEGTILHRIKNIPNLSFTSLTDWLDKNNSKEAEAWDALQHHFSFDYNENPESDLAFCKALEFVCRNWVGTETKREILAKKLVASHICCDKISRFLIYSYKSKSGSIISFRETLLKTLKYIPDTYVTHRDFKIRAALARTTKSSDIIRQLLTDSSKEVVNQAASRAELTDLIDVLASKRVRYRSIWESALFVGLQRDHNAHLFMRLFLEHVPKEKLKKLMKKN